MAGRNRGKLAEYRAKRDLRRSGEPSGSSRRSRGRPRFVVQRNAASSLHFDDVAEGLERGHLPVWLDGEKIRGGFALTHARLRGDDRNWLLVKVDDAEADRRRKPTRTRPESVLSGRVNEDL